MPSRTADANLALGRGLLLRLGEHVLRDRGGNDDDAVVVPDDPVAGLDPHVADRHRNLRRLELPAPRRVLGRDEAGEDRKALVADEGDVAAAAVEHAAGDAARLQRRHGQLAEVRGHVLVAGVDGDASSGHVAEHREHLADRLSYDAESGFGAGPPFTVYAGPARRVPRSSGRIAGGSV